jgi:hypothetical protein
VLPFEVSEERRCWQNLRVDGDQVNDASGATAPTEPYVLAAGLALLVFVVPGLMVGGTVGMLLCLVGASMTVVSGSVLARRSNAAGSHRQADLDSD